MSPALTRLDWRRAKGRCESCQIPQGADEAPFEIDHIIARKHLGPTIASNPCLRPKCMVPLLWGSQGLRPRVKNFANDPTARRPAGMPLLRCGARAVSIPPGMPG